MRHLLAVVSVLSSLIPFLRVGHFANDFHYQLMSLRDMKVCILRLFTAGEPFESQYQPIETGCAVISTTRTATCSPRILVDERLPGCLNKPFSSVAVFISDSYSSSDRRPVMRRRRRAAFVLCCCKASGWLRTGLVRTPVGRQHCRLEGVRCLGIQRNMRWPAVGGALSGVFTSACSSCCSPTLFSTRGDRCKCLGTFQRQLSSQSSLPMMRRVFDATWFAHGGSATLPLRRKHEEDGDLPEGDVLVTCACQRRQSQEQDVVMHICNMAT